jgi:serine/threonine-protein kinase
MTSADTSTAEAEDEALRQTRLSTFGRVLALVAAVLVGIHSVFSIWLHEPIFDLEVVPETIATVAFATLWVLLRKEKRSARFVRICELTTLFIGTGGFAAMAIVLPIVAQPESVVRGAMTYLLLAYAAYVPSTAKRTLLVASLMTVPLIACVFLSYLRYDPALHDPPAATWPKGPVGEMAYGVTVYSFVWWSLAVAIAVGASGVIYGLRKAVSDIRRLGQYTLEEKLGEGGMGVVYRASHAMLRRPTAVKLLLPERAGQEALARFEREVRRTAMLTHPNTVTIFDYGRTAEGVFYYAMEILEGATLHEIVETDGPQPDGRVIHLLAQAAASLAEAHDAGLIHRDVKPGNIMVLDRGGIPDLVKVLDFGLAKDVGPVIDGGSTVEAPLTAMNVITGTPLYIAPETLVSPNTIDARADLYALGALGYWLLTGSHVFTGRTVIEVYAHHMHTPPEPPSRRSGRAIAADLETLILACLAKIPADRPESARVLRARLLACSSAGEWTTERAAVWWRDHRDDLRSRRTPATTPAVDPTGATLTIARAAE